MDKLLLHLVGSERLPNPEILQQYSAFRLRRLLQVYIRPFVLIEAAAQLTAEPKTFSIGPVVDALKCCVVIAGLDDVDADVRISAEELLKALIRQLRFTVPPGKSRGIPSAKWLADILKDEDTSKIIGETPTTDERSPGQWLEKFLVQCFVIAVNSKLKPRLRSKALQFYCEHFSAVYPAAVTPALSVRRSHYWTCLFDWLVFGGSREKVSKATAEDAQISSNFTPEFIHIIAKYPELLSLASETEAGILYYALYRCYVIADWNVQDEHILREYTKSFSALIGLVDREVCSAYLPNSVYCNRSILSYLSAVAEIVPSSYWSSKVVKFLWTYISDFETSNSDLVLQLLRRRETFSLSPSGDHKDESLSPSHSPRWQWFEALHHYLQRYASNERQTAICCEILSLFEDTETFGYWKVRPNGKTVFAYLLGTLGKSAYVRAETMYMEDVCAPDVKVASAAVHSASSALTWHTLSSTFQCGSADTLEDSLSSQFWEYMDWVFESLSALESSFLVECIRVVGKLVQRVRGEKGLLFSKNAAEVNVWTRRLEYLSSNVLVSERVRMAVRESLCPSPASSPLSLSRSPSLSPKTLAECLDTLVTTSYGSTKLLERFCNDLWEIHPERYATCATDMADCSAERLLRTVLAVLVMLLDTRRMVPLLDTIYGLQQLDNSATGKPADDFDDIKLAIPPTATTNNSSESSVPDTAALSAFVEAAKARAGVWKDAESALSGTKGAVRERWRMVIEGTEELRSVQWAARTIYAQETFPFPDIATKPVAKLIESLFPSMSTTTVSMAESCAALPEFYIPSLFHDAYQVADLMLHAWRFNEAAALRLVEWCSLWIRVWCGRLVHSTDYIASHVFQRYAPLVVPLLSVWADTYSHRENVCNSVGVTVAAVIRCFVATQQRETALGVQGVGETPNSKRSGHTPQKPTLPGGGGLDPHAAVSPEVAQRRFLFPNSLVRWGAGAIVSPTATAVSDDEATNLAKIPEALRRFDRSALRSQIETLNRTSEMLLRCPTSALFRLAGTSSSQSEGRMDAMESLFSRTTFAVASAFLTTDAAGPGKRHRGPGSLLAACQASVTAVSSIFETLLASNMRLVSLISCVDAPNALGMGDSTVLLRRFTQAFLRSALDYIFHSEKETRISLDCVHVLARTLPGVASSLPNTFVTNVFRSGDVQREAPEPTLTPEIVAPVLFSAAYVCHSQYVCGIDANTDAKFWSIQPKTISSLIGRIVHIALRNWKRTTWRELYADVFRKLFQRMRGLYYFWDSAQESLAPGTGWQTRNRTHALTLCIRITEQLLSGYSSRVTATGKHDLEFVSLLWLDCFDIDTFSDSGKDHIRRWRHEMSIVWLRLFVGPVLDTRHSDAPHIRFDVGEVVACVLESLSPQTVLEYYTELQLPPLPLMDMFTSSASRGDDSPCLFTIQWWFLQALVRNHACIGDVSFWEAFLVHMHDSDTAATGNLLSPLRDTPGEPETADGAGEDRGGESEPVNALKAALQDSSTDEDMSSARSKSPRNRSAFHTADILSRRLDLWMTCNYPMLFSTAVSYVSQSQNVCLNEYMRTSYDTSIVIIQRALESYAETRQPSLLHLCRQLITVCYELESTVGPLCAPVAAHIEALQRVWMNVMDDRVAWDDVEFALCDFFPFCESFGAVNIMELTAKSASWQCTIMDNFLEVVKLCASRTGTEGTRIALSWCVTAPFSEGSVHSKRQYYDELRARVKICSCSYTLGKSTAVNPPTSLTEWSAVLTQWTQNGKWLTGLCGSIRKLVDKLLADWLDPLLIAAKGETGSFDLSPEFSDLIADAAFHDLLASLHRMRLLLVRHRLIDLKHLSRLRNIWSGKSISLATCSLRDLEVLSLAFSPTYKVADSLSAQCFVPDRAANAIFHNIRGLLQQITVYFTSSERMTVSTVRRSLQHFARLCAVIVDIPVAPDSSHFHLTAAAWVNTVSAIFERLDALKWDSTWKADLEILYTNAREALICINRRSGHVLMSDSRTMRASLSATFVIDYACSVRTWRQTVLPIGIPQTLVHEMVALSIALSHVSSIEADVSPNRLEIEKWRNHVDCTLDGLLSIQAMLIACVATPEIYSRALGKPLHMLIIEALQYNMGKECPLSRLVEDGEDIAILRLLMRWVPFLCEYAGRADTKYEALHDLWAFVFPRTSVGRNDLNDPHVFLLAVRCLVRMIQSTHLHVDAVESFSGSLIALLSTKIGTDNAMSISTSSTATGSAPSNGDALQLPIDRLGEYVEAVYALLVVLCSKSGHRLLQKDMGMYGYLWDHCQSLCVNDPVLEILWHCGKIKVDYLKVPGKALANVFQNHLQPLLQATPSVASTVSGSMAGLPSLVGRQEIPSGADVHVRAMQLCSWSTKYMCSDDDLGLTPLADSGKIVVTSPEDVRSPPTVTSPAAATPSDTKRVFRVLSPSLFSREALSRAAKADATAQSPSNSYASSLLSFYAYIRGKQSAPSAFGSDAQSESDIQSSETASTSTVARLRAPRGLASGPSRSVSLHTVGCLRAWSIILSRLHECTLPPTTLSSTSSSTSSLPEQLLISTDVLDHLSAVLRKALMRPRVVRELTPRLYLLAFMTTVRIVEALPRESEDVRLTIHLLHMIEDVCSPRKSATPTLKCVLGTVAWGVEYLLMNFCLSHHIRIQLYNSSPCMEMVSTAQLNAYGNSITMHDPAFIPLEMFRRRRVLQLWSIALASASQTGLQGLQSIRASVSLESCVHGLERAVATVSCPRYSPYMVLDAVDVDTVDVKGGKSGAALAVSGSEFGDLRDRRMLKMFESFRSYAIDYWPQDSAAADDLRDEAVHEVPSAHDVLSSSVDTEWNARTLSTIIPLAYPLSQLFYQTFNNIVTKRSHLTVLLLTLHRILLLSAHRKESEKGQSSATANDEWVYSCIDQTAGNRRVDNLSGTALIVTMLSTCGTPVAVAQRYIHLVISVLGVIKDDGLALSTLEEIWFHLIDEHPGIAAYLSKGTMHALLLWTEARWGLGKREEGADKATIPPFRNRIRKWARQSRH